MFKQCGALLLAGIGSIGLLRADLNQTDYALGTPQAALAISASPANVGSLNISCVYYSVGAAPGALNMSQASHYVDVAYYGATTWQLRSLSGTPGADIEDAIARLNAEPMQATEALCGVSRRSGDINTSLESVRSLILGADSTEATRAAEIQRRTLTFFDRFNVRRSIVVPASTISALSFREWMLEPGRTQRVEYFRPTFKVSGTGCSVPDSSAGDPEQFTLTESVRAQLVDTIDPTLNTDRSRALCKALRVHEASRIMEYCATRTLPVGGVRPTLVEASIPICRSIEPKLGRDAVEEALEVSASVLSDQLAVTEPRLSPRAHLMFQLFGGNMTVALRFADRWDIDFEAFLRPADRDDGWETRAIPPILGQANPDSESPVPASYDFSRDRQWLTLYASVAAGMGLRPVNGETLQDRNAHRLCRLVGKVRMQNQSRGSRIPYYHRSARAQVRNDSEDIACECEKLFDPRLSDVYFRLGSGAPELATARPRQEFGGMPRSGSCAIEF